jgi:hypothetical protein
MSLSIRSMMAAGELAIQATYQPPKKKCNCGCGHCKGENKMSKEIKAERQSPNSVSTPAKKQEPTAEIWKKGGAKSPDEALSTDKNSVRQPVKCGK